MAGKRSRKRLRCKAGRRVATKHAPQQYSRLGIVATINGKEVRVL